jgi:hypothetical protein
MKQLALKRKIYFITSSPHHFIAIIFSFLITSCGIYSFSGASISPDIKSVTIDFFPNHATIVQPVLSQAFTEKLKEKFVTQTSLRLIEKDGDLHFEGSITDYNTQPIAIQGTQTAALNRLTITVSAKFSRMSSSINVSVAEMAFGINSSVVSPITFSVEITVVGFFSS